MGVGVRIEIQVFRMKFYTHTLRLGSMVVLGIFFFSGGHQETGIIQNLINRVLHLLTKKKKEKRNTNT